MWYFDTSVIYPQWFCKVKIVIIPPRFVLQQYLWDITIQPAGLIFVVRAAHRLGENRSETGLLASSKPPIICSVVTVPIFHINTCNNYMNPLCILCSYTYISLFVAFTPQVSLHFITWIVSQTRIFEQLQCQKPWLAITNYNAVTQILM